MNNPQQPQMKVDISQTVAVSCESCENDTFIPSFKIRKLSALLSPHGKETMVPMQVFACAKCGNINKAFLPEISKSDDTV